MDESTRPIIEWFVRQRFQITYESSAVFLLVHAELPGVEVRVGTVYSVVERDGVEIYRASHTEFDPAIAHERIFGSTP